MKRLLILVLFSCSSVLNAQPCLPKVVTFTLGISNFEKDKGVSLFSNPSNETISIKILSCIKEINCHTIEIMKLAGKPVISQLLAKPISTFSLNGLTPGIYSFHYQFDFFISPGLTEGSSATLDLTNDINAEATGHMFEDIFEVTKYAEIVSHSDGGKILLPKNFRKLKFPDFVTGGFYKLIWIQNSKYGQNLRNFWGVNNFEIVDIIYNVFKKFILCKY